MVLNPHASTAMIGFCLTKLLFGMFASKNKELTLTFDYTNQILYVIPDKANEEDLTPLFSNSCGSTYSEISSL